MVVTPWYITPNEEEAYDHYKAIRAELSIPLILYHNPYLTGLLAEREAHCEAV